MTRKHTPGFEMRRHPLKDGYTTAVHLAGGNCKLIAEVRGEKYAKLLAAAPAMLAVCIATLDGLKNMTTTTFAAGGDMSIREDLQTAVAAATGDAG